MIPATIRSAAVESSTCVAYTLPFDVYGHCSLCRATEVRHPGGSSVTLYKTVEVSTKLTPLMVLVMLLEDKPPADALVGHNRNTVSLSSHKTKASTAPYKSNTAKSPTIVSPRTHDLESVIVVALADVCY